MNDVIKRYQTDPAFHTVVETFRLIIRSATLTPSEVREAAMTACVIEEMHEPRPPLTCSDAELARLRQSWGAPPYTPPPAQRRDATVGPTAPTHDDGGDGLPNP